MHELICDQREIIRDTNLQAEKILGATKRTRDMLSNCSYRIPDFHESNFAQPDGKAEEQLDDDDNCAAATSSKASEKGHTATATTSSSGWAEEEDRALLISVARHGIGRWTQIRQDLNFTQTSAQMSQRFSRLARHRMKHIGKADNMDGPTEVYHTRKAKSSWLKSLSPSLLEELDRYNATEVWERIALVRSSSRVVRLMVTLICLSFAGFYLTLPTATFGRPKKLSKTERPTSEVSCGYSRS